MSDQQYVLADAEHDAERARLDLLEQAGDPISQRRLSALGIGPGWRCLEVGAGGGSMVGGSPAKWDRRGQSWRWT